VSQLSKESSSKSSDVDVVGTSQESEASSTNSVYKKLFRFNIPLLRVRLEYVNKSEVFDDLEVNTMFHPNQVANRDIIKFRKQKVVQQPDGTKINYTFSDDVDQAADGLEDDVLGDVEAVDLSEERKDTIDTMIYNYFMDKPESERLTAISLDEYTEAVRGAGEDGNVIASVLRKKRNAILEKFKTSLNDEKVAELHFNNESKIRDWFIATFKGEEPKLLSPGVQPDADWDDEDMDDDDDAVIVLN
jgi:hypothetical protein